MRPVELITISREFGAGGGELAAELGARLGWAVLDEGIAEAVARRLGVDVGDIEARDEHAPGILEQIGSVVLRTGSEYAPSLEPSGLPDPDEIAEATRATMLEAARSRVIVVGHGAQALFHDRADALHLRLVAPLEERVRRICSRIECGGSDAVGLARRMDQERASYIRRYYHRDWHDPQLYHLQINTGAVAMSEAASMVVALVEARRG